MSEREQPYDEMPPVPPEPVIPVAPRVSSRRSAEPAPADDRLRYTSTVAVSMTHPVLGLIMPGENDWTPEPGYPTAPDMREAIDALVDAGVLKKA